MSAMDLWSTCCKLGGKDGIVRTWEDLNCLQNANSGNNITILHKFILIHFFNIFNTPSDKMAHRADHAYINCLLDLEFCSLEKKAPKMINI